MFGDDPSDGPRCPDPGACRSIKEERDYYQAQLLDILEQMAASPHTFQVDGRMVQLFEGWRQEKGEREEREIEARTVERKACLVRAFQKIRDTLDPEEVRAIMCEAHCLDVADLVRPDPLLGDEVVEVTNGVWDAEETDMAAEPREPSRVFIGRGGEVALERIEQEHQRQDALHRRVGLRETGMQKIMATLSDDERASLDIIDLNDLRSTFTGPGEGF